MISIIFSTNRVDPKFDWFIDSLYNQTNEEERENIELIFVDAVLSDGDSNRNNHLWHDCIKDKFPHWKHSIPKPNIYQGASRKTKTEYFSPSNARNTGILLSRGEYIVFVDDVSVLMPGWWASVWQGFVNKKIICGAYQKHFEMAVENGNIISSRKHEAGIDSRWDLGKDEPVLINGSQLFGCSLAIPASDLISVNGFDELCDSIGGEDYHIGMRLNNAGRKIYYDRNMLTIESEELHNQPYLMLREDRKLKPQDYMNKLAQYGITTRKHPTGNWDSSHMMLDILHGTNQIESRYNFYGIDECRNSKIFPSVPEVENHWFDDKPLIEM